MAKKKGLSYEEKMISALSSLPSPLIDKKHGIVIVLENDRASSNENRIEHIIDSRHDLKPNDIKRIPKRIDEAIFKKDKERKDTYNLYIERNNYRKQYIKISMKIEFEKSNKATIKTIFITDHIK